MRRYRGDPSTEGRICSSIWPVACSRESLRSSTGEKGTHEVEGMHKTDPHGGTGVKRIWVVIGGTLPGENCPGGGKHEPSTGLGSSHFTTHKRYSPEETARLAHVHAGFITSRHWTAQEEYLIS